MAEVNSLTHLHNHGCYDGEQPRTIRALEKGDLRSCMATRWLPLSHPTLQAIAHHVSPSRWRMGDRFQGLRSCRFLVGFLFGDHHDDPPFFADRLRARSMLRC